MERKRDQKSKNKSRSSRSTKVTENLKSSKFRFLNEKLYTTPSEQALQLFKDDDHLFNDYHEGYRQQVEKWPKNPLDILIDELKKPKYKSQVVGDMGCGEGRLQLELESSGHAGKIYSFDVGKCSEHVIQADISKLPIKHETLDVGVFSLSLMGTNFPEFLQEANRVIKMGGILMVAEVVSRFKSPVQDFCKRVKDEAGFKAVAVKTLKDFFYVMIFTKVSKCRHVGNFTKQFSEELKPCIYKRR